MLARIALDDEWLATLDTVARTHGLALAPGKLAAEVRALSEAYNTGAFARSRSKGAHAARLMFSFPRDVPKMGCAVRELVFAGRLALPSDRPLRVLDVGAGLGASTWGLARMLAICGQSGAIESTMVDDDAGALAIARAIGRERAHDGQVSVRIAEGDGERDAYDVVLVGQSLGEIEPDDAKQVAFLAKLLERVAPDGSLVVVEPALRDRTRRLQRVRDALASRGVTIFAPCLHAGPCPMLAREGDWCHEDLPIDLPPAVAAIARAASLRWQGLTFSYLVLRRDGATLRDSLASPGALRVVSAPIDTKGKRELFLCGESLLRKIARLDRDEPRGGAWSNASRGDVLAFSPPLSAECKRVTADVSVTKVRAG
jgi:SAM-dependent methyltransferase